VIPRHSRNWSGAKSAKLLLGKAKVVFKRGQAMKSPFPGMGPGEEGMIPSSPNGTAAFRVLLLRSAGILGGVALLVVSAYFFIDKPVAWFVYHHDLSQCELFKWLTFTPVYIEIAAPWVIVWAAVSRAWRPLTRVEWAFLAAAVNLLITLVFKEHLKFVFGRYWPETFLPDKNPSLIQDGAYGFHFFHGGDAYASFPSGHTARIFAVMSVIWIAYPRWRWLCYLVCASVIVGLVGMNYHFVGDIIAGAALGFITGSYAARFFGLDGGAGAGPLPPPRVPSVSYPTPPI
jgi:membrane-associated phospholipid phosphatase